MDTPTSNQPTELDLFQRYIAQRHGGTLNGCTLGEAVEEFRLYRAQLSELRLKLEKSAASGTVKLTDAFLEERFQKLDDELAEEGIRD